MIKVYGFALNNLKGAALLSEVLKHDPADVDKVRAIETDALAEVDQGYPLLHNAIVVLMWGALETSIRDFLVRWLIHIPTARHITEIAQLRVRIGEYDLLTLEERMRFVVGALERELGSALKPGVGRFTSLLKLFGLTPSLEEDSRRRLYEMASARNLITHHAGIVDARFLELCPSFGAELGKPIRITWDTLSGFVQAAGEFAAEVVLVARRVLGNNGETDSKAAG